jgi:hypothetical protein
MEIRWISALIGGRASPAILRASFSVFRAKIYRGGDQVVVAAPRAIRSSRLQPHLGGNVERLVEWCGLLGFRLAVGIFGSSRSFIGNVRHIRVGLYLNTSNRQFFLLLRLRDGYGLLDPFGDFPSTTNNVRPTQGGAAAAARRRYGLEVVDKGLLKNFVVIFVFLEVLCTVRCFF